MTTTNYGRRADSDPRDRSGRALAESPARPGPEGPQESTKPTAPGPAFIAGDAAHAMASSGRSLAVVWRGEMTAAAVRATITPIGAAARRSPGQVTVAIVVEPSAPVPGDDARAALADFIRAGHPVRCTAIVAEGVGFRSSMVRSVVTSLLLQARQTTPMKVASTVAEAARWATSQGVLKVGSDLERDVVRTVEAARAKIGAR